MKIGGALSLHLALLIIISTLSIAIGLLIYFKDKKNATNRAFTFLTFSLVAWIITNYLCDSPSGINYALFWNRITMAFGSSIGLSLFYFAIYFPKKFTKISLFWIIIVSAITFGLMVLNLFTNLIVERIEFLDWGTNIIQGKAFPFFTAWGSIQILASVIILILQYRQTQGLEKTQMKFLFLGLVIFLFFAFGIGVILPVITGSNPWAKFSPYFLIFLLGFTAYAILKHHLLNIRVIATEALVVVIVLVLFIQTLLSKTWTEGLLRGGFLIIVAYFGYLLIRSVIEEIERRKEVQRLARELEHANLHLQELDRMKTEFVSIASHDLLTPISAIMGYMSMILDENIAPVENEKTRSFLEKVYASSKRLATLVQDLLNVSRIEQGRLVIDRRPINIEESIQNIFDELAIKARNQGLKFEFAKPTTPIPKVFADSDKAKEVLVNLLGNALKYTKEGGVRLTLEKMKQHDVAQLEPYIRDHIQPDHQEYIAVHVTDTGVGIPQEELPNLFQKFHRVGSWATRETQGTGLGLFIAKSIVEMMNGKIWAESEEGKGSTFSFVLPVAAAQDQREIIGDVDNLGTADQKEAFQKMSQQGKKPKRHVPVGVLPNTAVIIEDVKRDNRLGK